MIHNLLTTLSKKEIRSGMAEVIKHALISDENWLHDLMQLTDYRIRFS